MVPATEADRPEIESFLDLDPPRTMFPRANLAAYGMAGGHRLAMRFWLDRDGRGRLEAALGLTEEGMILPVGPVDPAAAAKALDGRRVIGLIGPPGLVVPLRAALGLADAPAMLDRTEPQYLLDLDRLVLPDGPGRLAALRELSDELVLAWLADYGATSLGLAPSQARQRAQASLRTLRETGSHVALIDDRTGPLSMSGFNAAHGRIVQVGGVYTPPHLRGRGHARRIVALHLRAARETGVEQATLFASSSRAAGAYEAIGFVRIGDWHLTLFDEPQEVRPG